MAARIQTRTPLSKSFSQSFLPRARRLLRVIRGFSGQGQARNAHIFRGTPSIISTELNGVTSATFTNVHFRRTPAAGTWSTPQTGVCFNHIQAAVCLAAAARSHTFFSLAAICLFLFTWLRAMLANFLATVRGRLMGMECLSAPSTGGTISMAVMHSSPACLVTILILDHREAGFTLGTAELDAVETAGVGFDGA